MRLRVSISPPKVASETRMWCVWFGSSDGFVSPFCGAWYSWMLRYLLSSSSALPCTCMGGGVRRGDHSVTLAKRSSSCAQQYEVLYPYPYPYP